MKTRLLALTALLCASAALPASAQPANAPWDRPGGWDRIGSVDFTFRPDHETEYGNFGGRVERLSFMARNANVRCQRVTATYRNGRTSEIYRGSLQRGRSVVVDIPGRSQMIRRIDFDCRSLERRGQARVDIAADIGQYRAEENGVSIDASTQMPGSGETVVGGVELARWLAETSDAQDCFASHWLEFASGRTLGQDSQCTRAAVNTAFEESGYNVKEMLLSLTQTDSFLYFPSGS